MLTSPRAALSPSLSQHKADVNCVDGNGDPIIHFAARLNQVHILSHMLVSGADTSRLDRLGNTVLHVAVERRNLESVECIIRHGGVDVNFKNNAGQTVLHALSVGSGSNAPAILTILNHLPGLRLDDRDSAGNTALYLAFRNGAESLCLELVRLGAHVGIENAEGHSILDAENQGRLLRRLLALVPVELPWLDESKVCQACKQKFAMLSKRKHHCRNCARLLCGQCTEHELPIPKFNTTKAQRICQPCFDALSIAASGVRGRASAGGDECMRQVSVNVGNDR